MQYRDFKNKFVKYPLIASKDVHISTKDKQAMRNQLRRWQNKKLLIKLRRGVYIFNKNDRKINPSRQFIANQLYMPSYISLEYALNFYGLIPERVFNVTSITTKKTMHFSNEMGSFSYQHLKPKVFRGFKTLKDEAGLMFFIAEPEKAVLDFFYFNLRKIKIFDKSLFEDSYRFQNIDILNYNKIIKLAQLFSSKKLMKITHSFCNFIKQERT